MILDDFIIEYIDGLGVNMASAQITPLPNGQVKVRVIEMKNTDTRFCQITRTGYLLIT